MPSTSSPELAPVVCRCSLTVLRAAPPTQSSATGTTALDSSIVRRTPEVFHSPQVYLTATVMPRGLMATDRNRSPHRKCQALPS
jgi:hypothetical protein